MIQVSFADLVAKVGSNVKQFQIDSSWKPGVVSKHRFTVMLEFYKQIEEQALRMANSAEHHNHRRFLSSFSDIYRISKR